VKAEKAAREAVPLGLNVEGEERYLFNPIFWILNRQGDVPFWFSLDNERIHALSITAPDADTRKRVFKALYPLLPAASQDVSDEEFSTIASGLSHGMPVTALRDIVTLTGQRALKASDVDDAVQCYRVGDLNMDNPWRGKTLHKEISNGTSTLEGRVKGQDNAVSKVLDVLKRTALGLTGAQAGSASTRPRGVLFFVGPTGVGKTELAKSITQLVFGDESAYIRFDMSEFSAEHSADRLIGAPPGYTGFDQGGELTNAMKENPFRVVLFDEIEKAHRLILDKFLQILEDGRLTDGRGETVSFSDALIIFTSNKGVSRTDEEGRVHYLVSPNDSRSELEDKIMGGIESYFHNELGRPELLNRFGENFVIFNFISPEVAQIILQVMLGRVKKRLQDECALELVISDKASNTLSDICTTDLMNGARGIGAKLEDALVNPLARVVFDLELGNNSSAIQINEIAKNEKGIYYLDVENSD
jgi:ATP-dependent Clp protease ATP-binding subunit ClpA